MSDEEKHRYISTVALVSSSSTFQLLYYALVNKYHTSFSTLAQSTDGSISHFLLWHRYFLLEYEDLLRMVHHDITIPYWDWSFPSSTPYSTPLFNLNTGFGNSSNLTTSCVTSGPFQESKFSVARPNTSSPKCLMRKYESFIFPAGLPETLVSANVTSYTFFHAFVQIFLGLNIRCFVGGDMCSTRAPIDPLFMLHLAGMDRFVQLWQDNNPDDAHLLFASTNKGEGFLAHTFDSNLQLKDFGSNEELAYGTCVKYSPAISQGLLAVSSQDTGGTNRRASLSSLCLQSGSLMSESGVRLSEMDEDFISSICNVT